MRVLVVEDDRMIAKGLHTALKQDGYAVDGVGDGRSAAEALRSSRFDLVLLDLGLPERDGLDGAARAARARRCDAGHHRHRARRCRESHRRGSTPARMTTSSSRSISMRSRARMRSVLRRAAGRGDPCIRHRGITLDPVSHAVERDGEPVRPVGPRILGPRSPAAAPRLGAVARAARGPACTDGPKVSKATPSRCTCTGLRRKLGTDAIRTLRGVGYFVPKD